MKPDRWREIERLYHAVRDRKPEERGAFLKEACTGKESLRKEVESLIACRAKAKDFMESAALSAADGMPAENQTAEPAAGHAGRVRELARRTGPRPDRQRMLMPWWILLLSVPFMASAAFLWFQLVFGREPAGWMMEQDNRAGSEGWNRITAVDPQTPAARAGVQSGDLIPSKDLDQLRTHPHADQHRFEVKRRGESLGLILTLKRKGLGYWLSSEGVRTLLLIVDSMLYLILAGILVLMRPQDSAARWGAILLAQLGIQMLLVAIESAGSSFILESAHALRTLPMPAGPAILLGMSIPMMVPAGAFGFLGGFPRTLLTGWRAWLFIWAVGILVTIPIDLRMFWLPVYAGASGPVVPVWLLIPGWVIGACYLAASFILLVRNYKNIAERNERRRLRLVAAGFGVAVFAITVVVVVTIPWGPIERFRYAYWQGSSVDSAMPLLFAFAPVCTAYAILRHRVFDIHVMIRLGLRYAAARGLLLSIIPVTGLVLALNLLTHGNQPLFEIARRRGLIYAAVLLGGFLLHVRQKTWLNALDRRFFRERYDARQILSAVVDDVRRAGTFDEAASHVISQIEGALHPEFAALMAREPGAGSFRAVASTCGTLPPILADAELIALMRLLNKPLENAQSQPGRLQQQLPREEAAYLQETQVEWLFPVSLGVTGTEAILMLGPKRSEEPYSQEDRELLSAIAGSLALLLERSPKPAAVQASFGECPQCGTCYDAELAVCNTDGARLLRFPFSRTLAQRYIFERRLGRGGMGSVYQAHDTDLERRVAVKVIRSEKMPGADAVDRFHREAKAAAGFAHPNVVTVYDFGVAEDDRAYLVMELLSGCNLREELLRNGRLDSKRALEILSGVSSAIAAAHERMLLHRDLKPENIFLARSESAEVAKILDFGLAKPMTQEELMESMPGTPPGTLIGTLAYMSPERIRGGPPTESWDLWALAVVAFEMLTGVHPFSNSTDWRSVLIESRFPPIEDAPALPRKLREFFDRTLAVDRSQRPPSARDFIVELETALQEPAYQRSP